ncbi:MAG: shikimate kinase [Lachnospiraceae bacterium]|nr:shikimate kinase [Lachnospiraceae bacterium]
MKNLILEGFMGCGKSRVARQLALDLALKVIDTDDLIEEEQGRKISNIFEKDGEEAFRDMETQALRNLLSDRERQVISLGGGMPVREENRRLLKELGTVIYLKADVDVLIMRLEKGVEKRPMLAGHDLRDRVRELLSAREMFYDAAADLVIDIGQDDPQTISERIIKELGK